MEAAAYKRLYPHEYYGKFIAEGTRPDGRPLGRSRAMSVGRGVVTTANGSALVKIGGALHTFACECLRKAGFAVSAMARDVECGEPYIAPNSCQGDCLGAVLLVLNTVEHLVLTARVLLSCCGPEDRAHHDAGSVQAGARDAGAGRARDRAAGGRGLHSSTFRLNVSTFCGTRWAHEFPPVY